MLYYIFLQLNNYRIRNDFYNLLDILVASRMIKIWFYQFATVNFINFEVEFRNIL